MASSAFCNNINSTQTLLINSTSSQAVTIGGGGGLVTVSSGLTSSGTNTLGTISGTSASFSSTLGVTGLATLGAGLTITSGALSGTSASFSSTVGVSGLLTASAGFTSTAGTNTLGTISGTSATFSSTLGVTGLATFGAGGLTSTAGTNTLGNTTFTGSSTIDLGGNVLTNAGTGSGSADLATKGYVDMVLSGLETKQPVVVATTVAGTLATSFENGDVIDGYTLVTGDRILLKDQASSLENGVYIVNASGAPTRATDFGTGYEASGAVTFVTDGVVNKNSGFICSSPSGADTVGTDSITFLQFTGAGDITAGTGLSKSGNTLSVDAIQTQVTEVGTLTALTVSPGGITSTTGTNNFGSTTFSSNINMSSNKVTSLGTPTISTDAATKSYVDTVHYIYDFKKSVIVATTAAGTLATSFANGSVIDGVTLITGNRILIKNQASAIENGIYTVNATGAPTRAVDLNTGASASGSVIFVLSGTSNIYLYFICSDLQGSDVVGTNSINFNNAVSTIIAGTGLTKTGDTLSVNASQTQITSVGTLTGLSVSGTTSTNSLTVNGVSLNHNLDDIIAQVSFTGANNVASPANVTGFSVNYLNTRAFEALVSVTIVATTSYFQVYKILSVQNTSGWFFEVTSVGGVNDSSINFSITTTGQIQYTSGNYAGFTSLTMKFRLLTLTV